VARKAAAVKPDINDNIITESIHSTVSVVNDWYHGIYSYLYNDNGNIVNVLLSEISKTIKNTIKRPQFEQCNGISSLLLALQMINGRLLKKHINSNIYSFNFTKLNPSENIAPGLFKDHSRAYHCLKFAKKQSKYFYTMFSISRLPWLLYLKYGERTFRERKFRELFTITITQIQLAWRRLHCLQNDSDVLRPRYCCMRYPTNAEVVSQNFLVIPCNYISRVPKKTKTWEDNFHQSTARNFGRTILQDKVSWYLYERRSRHENQSTRIQGSGKKISVFLFWVHECSFSLDVRHCSESGESMAKMVSSELSP